MGEAVSASRAGDHDWSGIIVGAASGAGPKRSFCRENLTIELNDKCRTWQGAWLRGVRGFNKTRDLKTASTRGCRTTDL